MSTVPYGSRSFGAEQKEITSQLLAQKVGAEHLASRSGGGSSSFTYIEGWKAIELANSLFGFEGWSSSVELITPDFSYEKDGLHYVGVTAIVKITLKDGTFHEDVGFGSAEKLKHKGLAMEHAKKEAVTDARKRALRFFGNALGNCIYDKEHTKSVKPGKNAVGIMSYDGLRNGTARIHQAKTPNFLAKSDTQTSTFFNTTFSDNNQPTVAPTSPVAQRVNPYDQNATNTSPIASLPPSSSASTMPTVNTSPARPPTKSKFAATYGTDMNTTSSSPPPTNNSTPAANNQPPASATNLNLSAALKSSMINNISSSTNNIKSIPVQTTSQTVSPNNPYTTGAALYDDSLDESAFDQIESAAMQQYNQQPNYQQSQPQQSYQQQYSQQANYQQSYQSSDSSNSPQTPSPSHQKTSPYQSSFLSTSPTSPNQQSTYQQDGSSSGSGETPPKRARFLDVTA